MLTKYKLLIGSTEYELQDDDLKNWDEVICVYKRAEYGGVVRSFTSKFEFVNKAYRLLMDEFDRKGLFAKAKMLFYVIDNNWRYNLTYQCDLDFATLTYSDYVLSMHAMDNSVASIIRGNKSVKYEFLVGEDVPTTVPQFLFDRLKMIETATYEITEGSNNDDGSLTGEYTTDKNYRLYVGLTNSEIAVGGTMLFNDDQTYGDGFMLQPTKATEITLDYSIIVDYEVGCAPLILMNNNTPILQLHGGLNGRRRFLAYDQPSLDAVMNYINSDVYYRNDWANNDWSGHWVTIQGIAWVVERDSLNSNVWVNTGKKESEFLKVGVSDTITFNVHHGDKIWLKFNSDTDRDYKIYSSSLKFSWQAKGKPVTISSIAPNELLKRILWKMGVDMDSTISTFNPVISRTLLLPAECIRNIPGAKIYVSFNDFCKWMEAVFGYIYVIDDENGILEFKHRSEIFTDSATVIEIEGARDFSYQTESDVLYSSVIVGYDKKDYDSVNGRDEFNFNTSYTTDYTVVGKKLELISPFRADSYGIEFLVEKRDQDTTDNSNDKDVFFVQGIEQGEYYVPNRTPVIKNSITGTLINGEFSPIYCVWVNREYISLMASDLTLRFASSEGNANIMINNIGMSDDLALEDCKMLTAGELQFTCGDLRIPNDVNSLIRVKSKDYIYEGYIRQVSFTLARPEAVEYTIMIKTKTPCS